MNELLNPILGLDESYEPELVWSVRAIPKKGIPRTSVWVYPSEDDALKRLIKIPQEREPVVAMRALDSVLDDARTDGVPIVVLKQWTDGDWEVLKTWNLNERGK